jgi:plasmid stabilization system protein ParE
MSGFTASPWPRSTTRSTTTSRGNQAGEELEDEIDAVVALIRRFPESAPQWKHRRDRRVAVLDRFPFTLPYQIVGDDIVILALAHTSRRPSYWARRR